MRVVKIFTWRGVGGEGREGTETRVWPVSLGWSVWMCVVGVECGCVCVGDVRRHVYLWCGTVDKVWV